MTTKDQFGLNALKDEEGETMADMEMSTSPTSSKSPSPILPIGSSSDVLPNVNSIIRPPPPPPIPWFANQHISMTDPSSAAMYMMLGHLSQQYGYLPPSGHLGTGEGCSRQKETIRLKNAILYPPNPNAPLPPLRDRPPGCRTVFVGGLPEKCTEEILRELLDRCGEIQSVRMSKKNFAHVRFINYDCIDRALYFSGYRMKVEDRSDKEYTGRIHVDYAQARDDMHEWEMEKRVLEREQRRERERSSSPCSNSHFNENEAAALLDKLKDTETFTDASQLLLNWLDKGECSKKTSTLFYGMIAAVNAHVRRLAHDRRQYENELREFREKHNQRLQELLAQFYQIEKVFRLARKQKNWDHFSRAQRKNVDAWLKHAETIRKANEEAMLRDRQEVEMETSDDEEVNTEDVEPPQKKSRLDTDDQSQMDKVIEENTQLKAQLDELKKPESSNSCRASHSSSKTGDHEDTTKAFSKQTETSVSIPIPLYNSEMESRFVALLACFLNVHPFGASVDYMWAYLRQVMTTVRVVDIENTLERYPHLFRLQSSGVGANFERKWIFIGFQI